MDKSHPADSVSQLDILVVDDHDVTRNLLKEVLEKAGYRVHLAASGEAAVEKLSARTFPIVVSDIRMLELDGMAVLREVKKSSPDTAVILMTGFGSMEGAIEAIREGAFDYVSKPFKINDLKAVVSRAAKHWESIQLQRESGTSPGKLEVRARALIGKSPRIVEVYKTLARAAMSSSNVLVIGDSGTGKELVAKAIHENGPRRSRKFVTVNCGSLTESQMEAELFGNVNGTVARIEEADGGTLFLDEVGDLSPALQSKLLRVTQEGEFRPIGAADNRKVNVRLIAATHLDLDALVKAGKFREDLYYRLKVISIELPTLRERMEDLPDLVSHFLALYSEKNNKAVSHVSEEAMQLLRAYAWPGNVRELEHAIERAVAMTNTSVLFPEDFPPEITRPDASLSPHAATASAVVQADDQEPAPAGDPAPSGTSLEDMERLHIMKVLQDVNYNKSKASEVLGIDRATLYRKAQRYGIDLRGK